MSRKTSISTTKPSPWKIWFVAARPHTLTASVAPNIVAYKVGRTLLHFNDDDDDGTNNTDSSSSSSSSFVWLVLEWTAFCMLMQLGTNLHNDYADFVKGADNDKRVGQARATQKGWLTPYQTAAASGLTLLVGLFLGLWFVVKLARADETELHPPRRIAVTAFVVVTSIFNAFAYTGGPWPLGYIGLPNFSLGYSGLGDLFVFLYFGIVATLMPLFLHISCNTTTTNTMNNFVDDDRSQLYGVLWDSVPYAVQVATLATNIIVVNNLRDRHTDVGANKRTLAVRFGATFCRVEYAINLAVAYGLSLWLCLYNNNNTTTTTTSGSSSSLSSGIIDLYKLLPFLSLPLAWNEWKAISTKEGSALNEHVGGAAKLQLLFCVLLSISV